VSPQGGAQTNRPETDPDVFGDRARAPASLALPQARGPALESTISPRDYYVGPSDIFAVNIWTSTPLSFQLTVTPEGTLIIPTVGEVPVADMTLADAKKKVLTEIRKRYVSGEPTVTLLTPRPIVVSIRGQVLHPGSYVMAAYNRVDKSLEEANKLSIGQPPSDLEINRNLMSTRRILLRHKDGTQVRVDIQKFLATKEDRWNPYLREGDIVVVPTNDFTRNVIGVYGEVNAPGRYEYVDGDSVKDALRMVYGFAAGAGADSIEFTRQNLNGEICIRLVLNGRKILQGTAEDFALQPGDRLLVRGRADHRGDYRVKVAGEVLLPGTYPITRDSTRLADVIREAGGFTEGALLSAAEVLRQPTAARNIETERLESIRGGVPPEDSTYFYIETALRIRKEQVNADFVGLFVRGDSTQNIIMHDEDLISIPSSKKTVYVFGQVVTPGHAPFVPNEDVWYYIQKAGGVTDRARRGDVKVIKARTRQWLAPDATSIEEGDFVWVPKTSELPFGYYMTTIGQVASVLSVAISTILLVIQLKK
jgi:protein involved in polysaccharide export with SLBB domain